MNKQIDQQNQTILTDRWLIFIEDDDPNYEMKIAKCEEHVKCTKMYNSGVIDDIDKIYDYKNIDYILVYDFTSFGSDEYEITKIITQLKTNKIGIIRTDEFKLIIDKSWSRNISMVANLYIYIDALLYNKSLDEGMEHCLDMINNIKIENNKLINPTLKFQQTQLKTIYHLINYKKHMIENKEYDVNAALEDMI